MRIAQAGPSNKFGPEIDGSWISRFRTFCLSNRMKIGHELASTYSCGQAKPANLLSRQVVHLGPRFFQILARIVEKHTSEVFPTIF